MSSEGIEYALPGNYELGPFQTTRFAQEVAEYVNNHAPAATAFERNLKVFVTVNKTVGLDGSDFSLTGPWRQTENMPPKNNGAFIGAVTVAGLLLLLSKKR
ncbi:MAG: hypothetical protein CL510_10175 [Actinobacteria bacterium]|jgi:hypothetical protein|nr:hypothetical protein [Actinomycetota bacterium]|tara:strand:+ start:5220 stop:5522 length:303 start_codon:yes stop_codon:yes gene_type:complete